MKASVILLDANDRRLASGWLIALEGAHAELAIERGAAQLRAAYFLDGCRAVRCLFGSEEVEGRLHTCWVDNHRQWTVALADRFLPAGSALDASVSGLEPVEAA